MKIVFTDKRSRFLDADGVHVQSVGVLNVACRCRSRMPRPEASIDNVYHYVVHGVWGCDPSVEGPCLRQRPSMGVVGWHDIIDVRLLIVSLYLPHTKWAGFENQISVCNAGF